MKYPETQRWERWGDKLLTSKWQNIKEEKKFRTILTVKNAIELRKLGIIACNTNCKLENQAKKAERRVRGVLI